MDSLQPGQTLGPYRIINQIGQGGMATVYKAYHAAMDRYVAIKVLPRQLAESPEFIGRFQQEARTIANLEHPHILPVHDYGESDGITYLVMRYFDAGTLKNRLRSGPLSLAEVDRLFAQLAEALAYAHAHGVVHRDLKPANVLVDAQDNVFLTDFGIAKLLEGSSHFTATGAMVGTPAYMSPEQVLGQKVDQRSDIYSLGIILYQMVTGREPFEADTPLAVALKHANEPLPLPSTVKPGVAPAIERVILKALAKSPDDRFATAADFLAAWKQALREAEGSAEYAPAPATAMASLATAAQQTAPIPASSAASPAAQAVRPASRPALSPGLIGLLMVGLVGICVLVAVGGFFATRGLIPLTSQETPSPSVMATPDEIGSILATATQFAREGPATVEAVMATVTAAGGNITALPPALPTVSTPTPSPSPLTAINVTNNQGRSDDPYLAFDAQGNLHLVWYDTSLRPVGERPEADFLHRELNMAGQWSGVDSLTSDFDLIYKNTLNVLRNPAGQICASWEGETTPNDPSTIGWYTRCLTGEQWSAVEAIQTAKTATNDLMPAFASEGTLQSVYASFGALYFKDTLLSSASETAFSPRLAIDKAGGYHAVWIYKGDLVSLEYRYSNDGGQTWQEAKKLNTDQDPPSFEYGRDVELLADEQGNVHLIWNSTNGIFYRRWTSAQGWERAVEITHGTSAGNFDMTTDAIGLAHVVFWQGGRGMRYVQQQADNTWSAPRLVTDDDKAGSPRIVVDQRGIRHMVWTSWENNPNASDLYYAILP